MEEEDDEVLLKGSALYDYLSDAGYSDFQSVEFQSKNPMQILAKQGIKKTSVTIPKWASDHVWYILKCGLVLDDHRCFVENFLPLQTGTGPPFRFTLIFCSLSWVTTLGSLLPVTRLSCRFSAILGVFSSLGAFYLTKRVIDIHQQTQSLCKLSLMLDSLGELLIQFKRMIFLVQQNELIARSFSLHCSEMIELRKCVWKALNTSIKEMYEFSSVIREIPLIHSVDSCLHSFSSQDVCCVPSTTDETQLSMDSLKKLYNTYILIQSEFLRRLALCYCPEMWCTCTVQDIIMYSKLQFPKIEKWSRTLCATLVRDYKLFRVIGSSRGKGTQLRMPVTPAWDFSHLYVAVRSASLHLQSILVQNQDIEDLLESKDSVCWKDNKEFLESIVQILLDIQKELRSCQTCFDDSLVQVLKMTSSEEEKKLISAESIIISEESSELHSHSEVNPATDEVFELLVPHDEEENKSDEDDLDGARVEDQEKRAREREASKRVLQELKVVLVKKADEWRERERRAMESKGMVYSDAAQVRNVDENEELKSPSDLDWLPTDEQTVWPLPRLKGNISTHRMTCNKNRHLHKSFLEAQLQASDLRKARAEESKQTCHDPRPTPGFGASLLAEAMLKSRKINMFKTEDVFVDSGEEDEVNN